MKTFANKVEFKFKQINGLISILIPVLNDMEGLLKTLKYLKGQKFSDLNYEIIVGNDGENREIQEICNKEKIRFLNIEFGMGSYFVRNKLLEISRGEILAFIDAGVKADKLWLNSAYEELKHFDYVGGPIKVVKEDNVLNKFVFLYQKTISFDVEEYMSKLHFSPTANLFVKRKVFKTIGGFDNRLLSSGDYEFGNRVFASKKFNQHFSDKVIVYHEARNFKGLIDKQKRLSLGFVKLNNLYPDRFSKMNNSLLLNLIKIIIPPVWLLGRKKWLRLSMSDKLIVFVISYFFGMLGNIYKVYFSVLKPHVLLQER